MNKFDEAAYLELNADVAEAVRSGAFSSGWEHWLACGRAEGRLASIPASARRFDEMAYLDANPDVLDAVLAGTYRSGLEHWIRNGRAEGRRLRPIERPLDWNESRYLRLNPDIAIALREQQFRLGYEHWLRQGRYEGRPGAASGYTKTTFQTALKAHSTGVNFFGFQSTGIGLGAAARSYAGVLARIVAVQEFDVPWQLHKAEWDFPEPQHAINVIHLNPDILPLFLSRYGNRVLPERYNIAVWLCEMHAGYAEWHALSRLFNEIWSPSEYSARGIRTVSAVPVHVVPLAVDGLPEGPVDKTEFGWTDDVFTFVYVFDLASTLHRKNPLGLVRAFQSAFGARRDVRLVLKYHHAEHDAAGSALLARLSRSAPNIEAICETWPQERVYRLLRACDCVVSPHRGEGFGLNIAAGMYYGKPAIATGYSANMDFMTEENSFPIDYDLVPVRHDTGYYKTNYVWAEISETHLAETLTAVLKNPALARRRGTAGQKTIRESYSGEAVRRAIQERLGAVL